MRLNLAELAGAPPLDGARVPGIAAPPPGRAVPLSQVVPNPRNPRDVAAQPEKVAALAESIELHGQVEPCTVVTRSAYLSIFPEDAEAIGDARYVQVTGGRRHAAQTLRGSTTIDASLNDDVAATRARFLAATTAENIDREDYDVIEEAKAVHDLVAEAGTGAAAAKQLGRTPAWVTQRLNLLKLQPELHDALRMGMPVREVRNLHRRSREDQLAALAQWRQVTANRERADEARHGAWEGDQRERSDSERADDPPRPRRSRIATAIRRLGTTPAEIAVSLRAEMSVGDRRALATELLREDADAVEA